MVSDLREDPGLWQHRRYVFSKFFLQPDAGLDNLLQRNPRFDAGPVQHVKQIIRWNIARGRWGKRTSANSPNTCIKRSNARIQSRLCIRYARITRIMKMTAYRQIRYNCFDRTEQIRYLLWNGDADAVSDAQFHGFSFGNLFHDLENFRHRHFAFERTAKRR